MTPIVAGLTIATITTIGKWRRGKTLDIQTVVGLVGVAVSLALIEQIDKELARAFATLAIVGTLLAHADVIFGFFSSPPKQVGGPLPK